MYEISFGEFHFASLAIALSTRAHILFSENFPGERTPLGISGKASALASPATARFGGEGALVLEGRRSVASPSEFLIVRNSSLSEN